NPTIRGPRNRIETRFRGGRRERGEVRARLMGRTQELRKRRGSCHGNQPPSSAIPPVGLRLLIPAATGTTFPAITATTAAPPSTVASASSNAAAVRHRAPLVSAASDRRLRTR